MLEPDLAAEAALLSAQLGRVPTGGVIEQLAEVGPASVPELALETPLELALALWPFPLDEAARMKLERLGYQGVSDAARHGEQRFFNADKRVLLRCTAAGNHLFTDQCVIRDFLSGSPEARQRFLTLYPLEESAPAAQAFLAEAQAWWVAAHGFSPLEQASQT